MKGGITACGARCERTYAYEYVEHAMPVGIIYVQIFVQCICVASPLMP